MTIQEKLKELNACKEAQNWAEGKTWEEIYNQCHRGDWLLWLYNMIGGDKMLLTLAKGHCANTVRHLMTDERSIKAVDTAIAFGEGKASEEELKEAAANADAAVYAAANAADAYYAAVYAAANANAAAANAANADAAAANAAAYYAVDAAAANAAAYYAADAADARKKNQLETANICRKYLPIEIWTDLLKLN